MTDADQAHAMLLADGVIVDEADLAWIVAALSADLASGYDSDPAIYHEHVHDVVGALIGRSVSPTVLWRVMESKRHLRP